ncbi:hypothetical protein ACFVP3_29400 [Streptomyces sp. NPDC057806]|uniref:hypothetical protein n=1 Tax=Streptomyces sp. NPDC057806 TaxID=3346255 RepID=UPI00369E6288
MARAKQLQDKRAAEKPPKFPESASTEVGQALYALYRRAGHPSLDALDAMGPSVSRTTIYRTLRNPADVPSYRILTLAVTLSRFLPPESRDEAVAEVLCRLPPGSRVEPLSEVLRLLPPEGRVQSLSGILQSLPPDARKEVVAALEDLLPPTHDTTEQDTDDGSDRLAAEVIRLTAQNALLKERLSAFIGSATVEQLLRDQDASSASLAALDGPDEWWVVGEVPNE